MQRYVNGESIRQIAREEQRDRATVTKIVRSEDMNAFVREMRERLYGLGCDAMTAVEYELRLRKNGRLGYQLLTDIGIVPSPQEKFEIGYQPVKIDKTGLTPFQLAMAEDDDGNINRQAYGAACVMQASSECYGTPLPTPEEIRHRRRVAEVADQITDGRFDEICGSDGPEEKRVRQLADEIVKREESLRLRLLDRGRAALLKERNQQLAARQRSCGSRPLESMRIRQNASKVPLTGSTEAVRENPA